jgi:hypothetical protein
MDYELNSLLRAALEKHEFPPVLDTAATKAACEHDILLDENLMSQPEVMTSQSQFVEFSHHRRFCVEFLAAAIHAIDENQRLELSARTMAKLVAMLIL